MATTQVAQAQTDIEGDKPTKKGRGKKAPKLVANDIKTTAAVKTAAMGHNIQEVPELKAMMEQDLLMDENKKAISKDQREIRAKAKEEYNITAANWQHYKKMSKLDKDVRIQFESQHQDMNVMMGWQASLDLRPNTVARTEEEYVDPSAVATKLTSTQH